jgi:hypothetical protein
MLHDSAETLFIVGVPVLLSLFPQIRVTSDTADFAVDTFSVPCLDDVRVAADAITVAVHAIFEPVCIDMQGAFFTIRAFPGIVFLAVALEAFWIGQLGIGWFGEYAVAQWDLQGGQQQDG